ncbi:MAG: amidase [Actinomycetota bacterium]
MADDVPPTTIRLLAQALADGSVTARQLVERSLARIADPEGEGTRAFISVDGERALATAAAVDAQRAAGVPVAPFAGIPIAVKDLADIEGQVTTAGSVVLGDRPPASADAPVVARLRAAGFIPIGRTNMTEFAYSGLGLNSHHDTPRAPWDRETGRIPGGSSSGTAVAVADGMAPVGLGTDTGGSCRIPAAYCGIVGFKPTAARVPLEGIVPLAASLDSVGPLATSVDCCAIVDAVLAGEPIPEPHARPAQRLRLALFRELVHEQLDPEVAATFESAVEGLRAAGVEVVEISFPEILDFPTFTAKGGMAAAEAYAWHRELLATDGDRYDQRIRTRIEPGAGISAWEYLDIEAGRRYLMAAAECHLSGFDAFVLPTVALIPPTMASFDDDDPAYYSDRNLLSLRNTMVGNFLDTCAVSIPAHASGEPPVGLMLMGRPFGDADLLAAARTVEGILA